MSDTEQSASTPAEPAAESRSIARSGPAVDLRGLTTARVALDSTGVSVTTRHTLEFSLAHAQARDAVHSSLAVPSLLDALRQRELAVVSIHSAASNRAEYLHRPERGSRLTASSAGLLVVPTESHRIGVSSGGPSKTLTTLSIILADGLSALAVERHALPLLDALLPLLGLDPVRPAAVGWALTPIVIAEQARVALGDEIGAALGADVTVVLIGERPGLSSPASLGAYVTWAPRPGRTNAERNCVSNIRTEGLDYATAAAKIAWYVSEGRRIGLTGVDLRESDESPKLMRP